MFWLRLLSVKMLSQLNSFIKINLNAILTSCQVCLVLSKKEKKKNRLLIVNCIRFIQDARVRCLEHLTAPFLLKF